MGQVPAKYFLPSAPYGASEATNAINPVQAGATNPQTPLLPPNFQDPGTMQSPQETQRLFGSGLFGGGQQQWGDSGMMAALLRGRNYTL